MSFIHNIRISHKISALMVGLIVGFIVIGVTYYVQIRIENTARTTGQNDLGFRTQLANINAQLTGLINEGRNVITLPGEDNSSNYLQSLGEFRHELMNFQQSASGSEQTQIANNVVNQYDQYSLLFQSTVEQQKNLGYSQDLGLLGAESERKNTLVDTLNQTQQPQLVSLANIIGQSVGIDKNIVGSINNQWLNAGLDNQTRDVIAKDLSAYSDALAARASSQEAISQLQTELNATTQALSLLLASTMASNFNSGLGIEKTNADQRQIVQAIVTAIIFAVAMGTAVGVYFLYKSIVFPMVHMQSVIGKINRGKTATRVKVLSGDELGDLGKAFNQLLDERIKQLEDRSLENDQLNNSIISLIKALGMIAQKDLTIKVPVSSDITGTISDAVNLLTTETATTLHEVKTISEHVNTISEHLQEQSGLVMQFADGEKRQIIATAKALEILARAMNEVASRAETADASATKAIENTQQARHSVEKTVSGIRTIRETISETEKRTKRLGDRSQEISGIVNLINTIAERTHILALNASMHAASAGEAGRGFAVVADEVQRLAESARQSTDEIASMVNNMRVETSDTVAIMNTLIAQVADGSRLAEEAGKRMADTENATQALVEEVKHIAKQAVQQAEIANRVRDRSGVIRKFTEKTGKQLEEQKLQTDSLKQFAETLVRQVNVFTLPMMKTTAIALPKLSINNRDLNDADLDSSMEDDVVAKPQPLTNKPVGNISPLHAAS